MSLVSLVDVRALVRAAAAMDDPDLQAVIDRVEAEITDEIGAPQDNSGGVQIAETLAGGGESLFVQRPIASVVNIVEDSVTLSGDQYRIWGRQGCIERLPVGEAWGDMCVVTYKPVDQRNLRKQVIIDLVRLDIERTAQFQESVGGEYSYTAPSNWERERARVKRRLRLGAV